MAITRKPRHSPAPAVDVDALISRGGNPAGAAGPEGAQLKTATPILLRIPADMLALVDAALKARPIKLPRHTWILEAIHEKLTRDLQSERTGTS
jgi:hypothetical protein